MTTVFFPSPAPGEPSDATRTLLQRVVDTGCELYVASDGALVVRAPKGVLTDERIEKLGRSAGALVSLLRTTGRQSRPPGLE